MTEHVIESELLGFVVRTMAGTGSVHGGCSIKLERTPSHTVPICTVGECLSAIERECDYMKQDVGKQFARLVIIMTQSLKNEQREMALCLSLFCRLVVTAFRSGLPQRLVQRGYVRGMQRAQLFLAHEDSPALVHFLWRNQYDVLSVVHSRLLSHTVAHWQSHLHGDPHKSIPSRIAHLVVSAFAMTVQANSVSASEPIADMVLYHTIVGPTTDKSLALKSTLLMDIPVTREAIALLGRSSRRGLVVALFECSLELSVGDDHETIEFSANNTSNSLASSAEQALLNDFSTMLQRSYVQLIACQKRVHPYLVRKLKSLNIACISRVSVKYIGALARLSGARLLTTIPTYDATNSSVLDVSSLGYLRSVQYQHLFGKPFVVVRGLDCEGTNGHAEAELSRRLSCLPASFQQSLVAGVLQRQRGCVTVVVAAPTETTATLWQAAVEDCMRYLRRRSEGTAVVLPGKGIWMAGLVRELQRQQRLPEGGRTNSRVAVQTSTAERLFIKCIEQCAVLDGGAATLRRQLSPDGEGWEHTQVFAQFVLPNEAKGDEFSSKRKTTLVLQSPDGDEVHVSREARDGGVGDSDARPHEVQGKFWLNANAESFPPLDCVSGSLKALQVATDMACALLDVDCVYCAFPPV